MKIELVLPKISADETQGRVGEMKQKSLQIQMWFIKTFIVRDAANGNPTKKQTKKSNSVTAPRLTGDDRMVPSHPVV